jgi:uncharacterized linocin/CFP29 family protein
MSDDLERGGIWDSQTWNEISRAVLEDVGRVRVAQKVFPSELRLNADTVQADSLTSVPAPPHEASPIMIREGVTIPLLEIYAKFALTTSQVNNEAELRSAYTLAQLTSRKLALAEDLLLFQGSDATLPPGVMVSNLQPEWKGLLNLSGMLDPIVVDQTPSGGYGENTFRAVTEGISALTAAGHPGPYALILETRVFADTYAPFPNTLVAASDRISPLVDGRFFGTGTLPPATGLLVSLGGSPTTIFVGRDVDVVYNHNDPFGNHRFRLFERLQVVNREPAALLKLSFSETRAKRG